MHISVVRYGQSSHLLNYWLKLMSLCFSCLAVTCPCSPVVKALGCYVQLSVTRSVTGVQTSVHMHLPTKELFLIIPMHMMNREIIPGGESGFDGVIYKL